MVNNITNRRFGSVCNSFTLQAPASFFFIFFFFYDIYVYFFFDVCMYKGTSI